MILIIISFLAVYLVAMYFVYINPEAAKSMGSVLNGKFLPKHVAIQTKGMKELHSGQPTEKGLFAHKHTYVYIDSSRCGKVCQKSLFNMRQVHEAQGRNKKRIRRIMILTDTDNIDEFKKTILLKYPRMDIYSVDAKDKKNFLAQFAIKQDEDAAKQQRIYLVSPKEHIWLYYPVDKSTGKQGLVAPSKMLKDMRIILKRSVHG